MLNGISVDVEEYFHAANLQAVTPRSRWRNLPSRVVESTEKILEIFDAAQVRGTFFVLGYVARRHPNLVKRIHAAGHEIASHGYFHRIVYHQKPGSFLRDISITKALLEDITGTAVHGYRAPNFSIRPSCHWAYDALIAAGYRYDSSLFPVWHPRYKNTDQPLDPFIIERKGGALFELPLSALSLKVLGNDLRLPLAGGAYWRLLPRGYSYWGLCALEKNPSKSLNCYFHPWELDAGQPRYKELGALTRLRHYGGCVGFPKRLSFFLSRFSFSPLCEVIESRFGSGCLTQGNQP